MNPERVETADAPAYELPRSTVSWQVRDVTYGAVPPWETVTAVVAATAVVPYVEALAADLAKRTTEMLTFDGRLRRRGDRIRAAELRVSSTSRKVQTVIFLTGELSDEAHLALMDLDLSDDRYQGKTIYWNAETSTWDVYRHRPLRRGRSA